MLKEYEKKRDFERTPEPSPTRPSEEEGPLIFVVQKHAARRLHYDFRLELDGVLKSWAVPSGPSLDPGVKRLAVMVEDHPLSYASFEGMIPEGEYGAGQVIVWDRGDYSPDEGSQLSFGSRAQAQEGIRQGLAQGKLSLFLRGHKLKGSWTLVKMKRNPKDWLLIKHQDEFADAAHNVLEQSASVISGLDFEEMKTGFRPNHESAPLRLTNLPGSVRAPFPVNLSPMLTSSAEAPFSRPGWIFEPKLDGYRVTAEIENGDVRLLSRRGLEVTEKYPSVVEGLRKQPVAQLVLDGEIIAFDEGGKPCFQCLQGYLETMNRAGTEGQNETAIIYYVFDVMYLDGYDLGQVPLIERKQVLDRVLSPAKEVRRLEYFEGDGEAIYRGAVEQGLEGVIAKQKDSIYEAGKRSPKWLKIKSVQTDDFVIGGYTQGSGNRAPTFGALLLGYYDDQGRLLPAGHVGTGFDDRSLVNIRKRLDALQTEDSPFAIMPELNAPATWVRPELVAEVRFSQWTQDGRLRIPVYLRLRDDKPAEQVRRDQVAVKLVPITAKPNAQGQSEDTGASVLEQLKEARDSFAIEVAGERVNLSNLDKELWPSFDGHPALTKRDLLTYLVKVSPYLLEHLRDRPLTLSRYPDGIQGQHFFQKHWGSPVPEFVTTVRLSEHRQKHQEYLLCNNLATLLWLGQGGNLELHSWFSRISPESDMEPPERLTTPEEMTDFATYYPDFIIFDLDPYLYSGSEPPGAEPELNREGFTRTCEAAHWFKETLDALSLSSFVKTSGRTGLHIYVPILRQFDYHAVHAAAKTICRFVLERHPERVTTEWAVDRRRGKVFLDYNQNLRGKTLAAIYSPRPTPEATVSVPLRWDELSSVYPTDFNILNTPERLTNFGDLWADLAQAKRDLKHLLEIT